MSRSSSATINYTLTNFAQGHAQSMKSVLAEFLCPTVQPPGATGKFKKFDDRNSFQTYNTERALGGDAARIVFGATDGTYNCEPQSLETTVDNHERDLAGNDPLAQALLDQGKVQALVNGTVLSHDKKIIDFVVANTTAVAARGNWSNADIDPVEQLDEQLKNLANTVGNVEFLKLALGISSWYTLRNHPKVKARCSGVQVSGISLDQLKGMLMFPVDIRLGVLLGASNKIGQSTVTKTNLIGDNVILTMSSPSPTVYDPSGFKCLSMGTGNITAVRTYRPPGDRYDVHAIDWSEALVQSSSIATIRLAIT